MTRNGTSIESLVLRIQNAFLESPALRLTLGQATRRFGLDKTTCEALLDALVDTGVLARTTENVYTRFFPQRRRRARFVTLPTRRHEVRETHARIESSMAATV